MNILFGPEYPDKEYYSIAIIIHHLGYTVTLSPEDDFDFAMLWEDVTFVQPSPTFQEIARSKPVVNLGCVDISKRRVERVSSEIFGYGSFVDPLEYQGRCIKKADENAVRRGSVIECPVAEVEEGYVYQKIIDASDGDVQVEYRVPVIFGTMPMVNVWREEIPSSTLHGRTWFSTTSVAPSEVFSPEEQAAILTFAERLGLDFGEIDVLRGREDQKLYLLDANKTPAGYGMRNRVRWTPRGKQRAIAQLAECFDREIRARLANA